MPFKFNPLTNKLDYYESGTGASNNFYKTYKVVDSAFLLNKEIILTVTPSLNSEFVFVNGIILRDDCYSITGATLTFELTLPFKLGHIIDVRYSA